MNDSLLKGRYDRNFETLTQDEQKKLNDSRVVIIGLGGLGGGVVEMLARTGVGRLTLVDGDVFDETNLNRQILSQEHLIGTPKAEVASQRVRHINSEVVVDHHIAFADKNTLPDLLDGADVVMDCLDSIDSRFTLQEAAQKEGVPIVSGAIAGVTGQVTTIFPKDLGYSLIYGKKSRSQKTGVELKTGNISYCASLVSALQSSECIKVILKRGDILQNKLLIFQLWSNTFEIVNLI